MSIDKLKERGWYLTEAGLKKLTENKNNVLDDQGITKLALDADFREIAGGALNSLLKQDALQGNAVLQLVKVRNCSAPKSNEESKSAPRLLRIQLTDGQTQCQAVEMENIQALTLNLPPGTKILLKNGPIKCSHALLQLRANNVEVLGGHVVALVEKWEVNRSLAMYAKGARPNMGSNGPPRWIPFGKPIPQGNKVDESFNSMAEAQTKIIAEENHSEFDSQRNDAISEAIKTENKKVFGGGTKQLQDANVQKIMDKGFTEEQAKTALRYAKNNVEHALSNLKKREERSRAYSDREESQNNSKSLPTRGKSGKEKPEKPEGSSKPSTKISLFDFVEDKLPETTAEQSQPTIKSNNPSSGYNGRRNDNNYNSYNSDQNKHRGQNRFENNISASFASRNQGPPYGQQHGQNNYYNNSRNDRSDNRNQSSGYQGRRDYNDSGNTRNSAVSRSNTYPGPRDKRQYDSRDSYNSHQQQGSYNNRYQKDYNQQGTKHDFQPHQQQQSYSQKSDYRNDYKGGERHERNERYQSNAGGHDKSSSGYQRGGGYNTNRDYRQQQSNAGEKNDRSQGNNSYGSNSYEYQSNTAKSHHQNQQGGQNQLSGNKSYDYQRQGGGRSQQPSNYSKTEHHQSRGSPPGQINNSNVKSTQAKPAYSKPNTQSNISQVVDATANLKLGGVSGAQTTTQPTSVSVVPSIPTKVPQTVVVTSHQSANHQGQQQQQQQQPHQQQSQMTKNYVAIPNGTYNPYQIMGFHNKATNEFAMNALKTQQLPVTATAATGPAAAQPPPTVVPVVPITSVPATQMPTGQFVQPPFGHPPVIPSPQPMGNQFLPPGTTVAFNAVPVGMMPQVKFNVGEVCVAKYWEDERYYPAVITDVTEKTNVVRFVDYGNFEEVLKHDCLPLNAGPPGATFTAGPTTFKAVPVSAATQIIHHAAPIQHAPPQQQNMRGPKQAPTGNTNKPYREQRGVYIPPQKRM